MRFLLREQKYINKGLPDYADLTGEWMEGPIFSEYENGISMDLSSPTEETFVDLFKIDAENVLISENTMTTEF